jgi:hypothetical protein
MEMNGQPHVSAKSGYIFWYPLDRGLDEAVKIIIRSSLSGIELRLTHTPPSWAVTVLHSLINLYGVPYKHGGW